MTFDFSFLTFDINVFKTDGKCRKVTLKSWAGENRKILKLPISQSKLPSKDLKLKSYEVNLTYRK